MRSFHSLPKPCQLGLISFHAVCKCEKCNVPFPGVVWMGPFSGCSFLGPMAMGPALLWEVTLNLPAQNKQL